LGKLLYIIFEFLIRFYNFLESHEKLKNVICGKDSKFYKESKVYNFQNNPQKIIIGSNSHLRSELLVFGYGGLIKIGSNCYVGEGTRIWSAKLIEIGNNVLISHNCNLIDTDSHELNYTERAESFKKLIKYGHSKITLNIKNAPIIIEDNVWISYNVSILKGVRIGKGAIIGAGSVVTKDIPQFTIWAGNPAKFINKI
jgi:acetyltransferase-like isoleucine patch superfamily enzyme